MARLKNIIEKTQTVATIVTTAYSDAIDISGVSVFSADGKWIITERYQ